MKFINQSDKDQKEEKRRTKIMIKTRWYGPIPTRQNIKDTKKEK